MYVTTPVFFFHPVLFHASFDLGLDSAPARHGHYPPLQISGLSLPPASKSAIHGTGQKRFAEITLYYIFCGSAHMSPGGGFDATLGLCMLLFRDRPLQGTNKRIPPPLPIDIACVPE